MRVRFFVSAAIVAAGLGAVAAPLSAQARTVEVMGMSFEQPDTYYRQGDVLDTGSVKARRGHYVYDSGDFGRSAPAAHR